MQYSNAQILSAVVSKWLEPTIQALGTDKLSNILDGMPFMQTASNWMVKWGLAPMNYSMAAELSGYATLLSDEIVSSILAQQLSQISDAAIPQMAHSLVDKLIEHGEFKFASLTFSLEELQQLKNMLNSNLMVAEETKPYQVIMEEPKIETTTGIETTTEIEEDTTNVS